MKSINNVNNAGPAKNALIVIFTALGGVFIDAYDFTSLGIGVVQLKEQFHLSALQMGNLTAAMGFGALFGAIFGVTWWINLGGNGCFMRIYGFSSYRRLLGRLLRILLFWQFVVL